MIYYSIYTEKESIKCKAFQFHVNSRFQAWCCWWEISENVQAPFFLFKSVFKLSTRKPPSSADIKITQSLQFCISEWSFSLNHARHTRNCFLLFFYFIFLLHPAQHGWLRYYHIFSNTYWCIIQFKQVFSDKSSRHSSLSFVEWFLPQWLSFNLLFIYFISFLKILYCCFFHF